MKRLIIFCSIFLISSCVLYTRTDSYVASENTYNKTRGYGKHHSHFLSIPLSSQEKIDLEFTGKIGSSLEIYTIGGIIPWGYKNVENEKRKIALRLLNAQNVDDNILEKINFIIIDDTGKNYEAVKHRIDYTDYYIFPVTCDDVSSSINLIIKLDNKQITNIVLERSILWNTQGTAP